MYQNNEYKNRFRILKGGLISLVVSSNLYGAPTGGTVVSGTATISQNANTTNINQSSNKAIINWQDFSIKSNETVNFNQPNVNSITLNRVIGNEKSIIDGALNANGQVWLINSNGVLFGKNAKVNTAGIVASTKDISNEDFNNGNYNFKGNSNESIVNEGEIKSLANTHATFIANSVTNKGKIEVHKGTINLVGASDVTLTLNENQNISLKVNKGVLDSLVDNQNLLIANGGQIYLTTNAKDELLKGVVNNSGIIEANSLEELSSEVILFAHGGTTNVDGNIIAKNSFVETSGEKLNVTSNTKVVAKDWLLDPTDMKIESTGGSVLTGESVSATAIQNNLETTNVHLQATNNITVNQNITWSTDKQLKLQADNINVNATINNTNQTNGGVYFQAANTKNKVVFGTNGKVVVNNLYQLQWMNQALNGRYELGRDIDAGVTKTDTANWGIEGFNPIGNSINKFNGTFDGLGFTISNLYINHPITAFVGLFGYTSYATIKNIGLKNVDITGGNYTGGLVGYNDGTISNSYTTGNVNGVSYIGGLVGSSSFGTISNSYATGNVSGTSNVGGLVGYNYMATIENSFYDKTKYTGKGVGNNSTHPGVTGKTTQEMSYGGTFKNASWDIVADSSVTSLTPVIKWDSANNKYVWAIAPLTLTLTYTLGDKTTTYNGTTQNLSTFYNNSADIFGTNHSFIDLSKYKFQVAGNDVTGYKDAAIYDNIKLVNNSDSFAILNTSGNTDGKLTINKKDLTISNITANNKTYDGTTTATLSNIGSLVGLVTGENLTLSNTSVVFSDKNVANGIVVTATGYTIADKDSFKASNYNLLDTSKTTTANISKASLTATLNDNSKTYDGTSYSEENGITFNGFVNGETASLLGGNLVYSGTSQGAKDAGNYIISGSGLTSNNYNISFVDGELTINKKDLTISAITANNKTYDGTTTATLSNSGTLVGLVTGEDLVLNNPTSVIFSSKDVGDNINVTATGYTIADKDSFKASNYNLTQTSKNTTANISKASLTATLNDNSKTYDGVSYSGGSGITFNGFVNGETASLLGGNLVYSGTSQGAKDVGNYIISGSGLTSNNYNISFVDGKLTINKKDLTISNITANNKTYDGTTAATLSNIGTLVGLVTGEDLVLNNPTSVIFSSKDVGDNIDVTATGYTISNKDSFKASNYNLLDTSKTTTANIVASVNPTPNPTPTDNNQKPKVDEKVQRVVASIEPSTNSNSSSNQSVPNSLNSNIRTLSFNGVDETRVINDGVRVPDNIVNSLDEL